MSRKYPSQTERLSITLPFHATFKTACHFPRYHVAALIPLRLLERLPTFLRGCMFPASFVPKRCPVLGPPPRSVIVGNENGGPRDHAGHRRGPSQWRGVGVRSPLLRPSSASVASATSRVSGSGYRSCRSNAMRCLATWRGTPHPPARGVGRNGLHRRARHQ